VKQSLEILESGLRICIDEGVGIRPSELQSKRVVGTGAKIIGTVTDVEFDGQNGK
jgi:hypothetical protein